MSCPASLISAVACRGETPKIAANSNRTSPFRLASRDLLSHSNLRTRSSVATSANPQTRLSKKIGTKTATCSVETLPYPRTPKIRRRRSPLAASNLSRSLWLNTLPSSAERSASARKTMILRWWGTVDLRKNLANIANADLAAAVRLFASSLQEGCACKCAPRYFTELYDPHIEHPQSCQHNTSLDHSAR